MLDIAFVYWLVTETYHEPCRNVDVVGDDNEEVFSDEEFEAEMKQKQKILTQTSQVGHMSADVSATVRGVARGESRGDKSPNRRLSGTFYEKNWLCWVVATLFSLPEVFCGLQICQNALAAGAPPPPAGGAHDAPPDP